MSYDVGDGKWSASEALVTFMIFPSASEPPIAIVGGILMSRGIPFFFFEPTKGNRASIRVPASRLEDARRAVAQVRRIGGEIEERSLFKE
jgi:hypothetical protein